MHHVTFSRSGRILANVYLNRVFTTLIIQQCSVLRRKTRQKNFKVDCHVEILKGYAIQGIL